MKPQLRLLAQELRFLQLAMLLTALLTGRKNAPQKSHENTVKYHVLQLLVTGKSSINSIFC